MKQTRLLSALLAFSAVPFLASAQPVVSNVNFVQQPDGEGSTQVVVNYDLVSDDGPSTVSLLYSLDANPFEFATAVTGDVGGGIDTGTDKEILWSVADDVPDTESTNFVVRILAEDGQPIGLDISATVADGGLTNDATQTITFTFAEAVTGFTADDVTVTNATKGTFGGSGAVYTLDVTADDDGAVTVLVPAGAANSAASPGIQNTASDIYTFDFNGSAPGLDTVTITSNNANPEFAAEGDTITLSITASQDITEPTVTIAGNAATVSGSDDSYTATYIVQASDSEGVVAFNIEGYEDLFGNPGSSVSSTTDSSSVTINTTAPTLDTVTIASDNADSSLAKEGDTITVSITASETISEPTVTIAGNTASVSGSGSSYTATYVVQASDDEGSVSFSIDGYDDAAGNAGSAVSATTDSSSVTIDTTAPTLDTVTIASDNANSSLAKEGDTITVSISASKTISEPTVIIAGNTASVSGSGSSYTATHVVQESDDEGNVSFSIDGFADAAGNAGIAVSATTNGSNVSIKTSPPQFDSITVWSNNMEPLSSSRVTDGGTITIRVDALETITPPTILIGGVNVQSSTTEDTLFMESRTVTVDIPEGPVPIEISNYFDMAGNPGPTITVPTSGELVVVDRTAPTIASTDPADEASVALLDEIEVTFTEEVVNLTAGQLTVNGSAADTVTGSNPYTFSGFDIPEIGSVTVNLAAGSTTDLAGNAFAGDSWSYESESLIEFVSVPGGTFVMGNSGVGDDLEYGSSYEGPSHDVTLSPYEIGKFQVTNAELAKVINWAMDQGLLAGSSMGHPYTLGYQLYMMEPDQDSTRKYLFSVNTTGSHLDWTGSEFVPRTINGLSMANHPAVGVTWYGAVAYCNFLAEIEGLPVAYDLSTWELIDADPGEAGLQYVASYRLPTEAEWERAAGWSLDYTTRFIYPTSSDTMDNTRATFGGNDPMGLSSNPRSSPVGWYDGIKVSPNGNIQTVDSPSPVGAYDMAGNTYEWVYDLESGYTSDAKVDPIGSSGPNRLVRGGFANSLLRNCRVSTRVVLVPNSANFSLGFRIVRVPD